MANNNNFQRIGSESNTQVGSDFEIAAKAYFESSGILLTRNHRVQVGVDERKKERRFDLGSDQPAVLVECKCHTWTATGNMPSAKLAVWNEAMFYFHIAPQHYRKILFTLRSMRGTESLATYYARCHGHLIPKEVEIWEYDAEQKVAEQLDWKLTPNPTALC